MNDASRRARRSALLASVVVALTLLPAAAAIAQYPPPAPSPTSTPIIADDLTCMVEAGVDDLGVRCDGNGFQPGSEVLAQVYGRAVAADAAAANDGVYAARADGEDLLVQTTVTAGVDADVDLDVGLDCCDLAAVRVTLSGVNAAGDPLVMEVVIDDAAQLAAVRGGLSGMGFDWLRWLATGLVLATAGLWLANVRDERPPAPA